MRRVLLIAGPTASGKSRLALELAARVGAVVVNADSMQVYRELRILTARPSPAEERRVPHRLYGHVPAAETYSVGRWLGEVAGALAEADGTGLAAIVVGGTGLYFRALTQGLALVPEIPAEVQVRWRARTVEGAPALHAELARRDPIMAARLRPSDPQRILRALEVLDHTGRSLAEWQAGTGSPLIGSEVPRFVLEAPRTELYARINRRAEAMIEAGGIEEAARLSALGLDPRLPVMRALGVAELAAAAEGRTTVREALQALQASTQRYAKRQVTWFRHQMADWPRLPAMVTAEEVEKLAAVG